MRKIFIFLLLCFQADAFAQVIITGSVIGQADTKPVANASVFLSNTTIGDKTAADGSFTLHNVKPGKYQLVVSIIGFENSEQVLTVNNANISVPVITIFPKTINLNEVKIKYKEDPNRERYLQLFRDQFLGTSARAANCTILNPEVLDLHYNDSTSTLTASSADFMEIENDALGYRIKYQLANFTMVDQGMVKKKVHYTGLEFLEEMQGSPAQERRWGLAREEAYENSPMHFLRAALANRLSEEGFRVWQYAKYANPDRPPGQLIKERIKFYKDSKAPTAVQRDSLAWWEKKSKLADTLHQLSHYNLSREDFVTTTSQPGRYVLSCDNDALLVAYNKNRQYKSQTYIDADQADNTLIDFNSTCAFFDDNGVISELGSMVFRGAWSNNRIAELLPYNYEPGNDLAAPTYSQGETVDARLRSYVERYPIEKTYLQFDKPYYAAGDTIYFKAYVTKGEDHRLSDLSGLLRVELINPKNEVYRPVKLQLDTGAAWGDFALPDTLPQGNYRIRAYTQWMRNAPEPHFFEKIIPIGAMVISPKRKITSEQAAVHLKPDFQFMPEGGSFVTGIRQKVGFKAIQPDGLGIDVKGEVVDNDNLQAAVFESSHLGMGCFYFTPAAGKTYSVKLRYSTTEEDLVSLPKAQAGGIVLSMNNDSLPKATVALIASSDYFKQHKNEDYLLVIRSGGDVITFSCKLDSQLIKVDILKRKLHTGIASATLFSKYNEPLCEREFFVQNFDRLSLDLSGNKGSYKRREKVSLQLNVQNRKGDAAEGRFSVAVINEDLVPGYEKNPENLLNFLQLSSDLRGNIEQPDYYFSDTSLTARKDLDLLMLTQGYRRFEWAQVLDTTNRPPAYAAEFGITIAGQVNSLFNKPLLKGTVTLLQPSDNLFLRTITDEKGQFRFPALVFSDTAKLVLSAVDAKNKNLTKITWFEKDYPAVKLNLGQQRSGVADSILAAYVTNDQLRQKEWLTFLEGKNIMLKPVNIRDRENTSRNSSQSISDTTFADQVMYADQIEQMPGQLITSINGRLRGVTFTGLPPHVVPRLPGISTGPMLVVVDGFLGGDLNVLNSGDVERIEVYKYSGASIYGMVGGNGVIVVTTKQGGQDPKSIHSIGVLPISPMGFYKAREFYSPKYDSTDPPNQRPDLRSTIYWKPELKTDANGNASFEYYNADGAGTYKITIEGIDKDGNIGTQVFRYRVE